MGENKTESFSPEYNIQLIYSRRNKRSKNKFIKVMIQKNFPAIHVKCWDWKCLAKLMKVEPPQQKEVTEISKCW